MFRKAIINKDKILTMQKDLSPTVTFPLAPSDLLLEVDDFSPCPTFSLEDLKREVNIT